MKLGDFAFEATNWDEVPATRYEGERGHALWRTRDFADLRVRMVEYSPGYFANHWCEKGHVVLCLAGRLETELADGRVMTLTPGMSYQVGDDVCAHRSATAEGARIFIVD